MLDTLVQTLALSENAWLGDKYIPNLDTTGEGVRRAMRATAQGWDAACRAIGEIDFPHLSTVKNPPDPDFKDRIKAERDRCKYAIEQLQKQFSASSETLLEDLRATAPAMERLLRLALDFGAAYQKEKHRRALVDYADLEHLAAQILTDEDGAPTALAKSVSERFREIMVDEYQDVSEVQDLIFRAVSRAETNLFFVGDVKQSIYRFRLADPTIFLDKYNRFAPAETAAAGAGQAHPAAGELPLARKRAGCGEPRVRKHHVHASSASWTMTRTRGSSADWNARRAASRRSSAYCRCPTRTTARRRKRPRWRRTSRRGASAS